MSIYDVQIGSLQGQPIDLAELQGKAVLVVNVASKCGLTPQYTGLEQLQKRYGDRGFTVLGVPCNQFAGQEPGTAEEVVAFCSSTYQVTFPLSEKLEVNGDGRSAVYRFLTAEANGFPGDITWNFEKFLIGRDGRVLHRYPPTVKPEDRGLMQDIAEAL